MTFDYIIPFSINLPKSYLGKLSSSMSMSMSMSSYSLLSILLGILPSIIWLAYFLRKDVHPEPNRKILAVFFWGAFVSLPAFLLELGVAKLLESITLPFLLSSLLGMVLGVALIEESLKYLVIRLRVLRSPEFDEPLDAMLYMIIAALGFAAVENVLLFFQPHLFKETFDPLFLSLVRFLGATFLHALCSATVGFFLALSLFWGKKHLLLLSTGLALATLLHGLYNFSIIEIESPLRIYILSLILLCLALFVSWGFQYLKKIKSVCL